MSAVDDLTNAIKELIEEALEDLNLEEKITEKIDAEIGNIDWADIVTDRVDFDDLVKESVDFEDLANDAISDTLDGAVEKHLRHLPWSDLIEKNVDMSEVIRSNVDLSEVTNQILTDGFTERWENSKRILETYIEQRLDLELRNKVEQVVEERLTGSFHDIDRDLDEKLSKAISPLLDEIAELKSKKSLFRRVAAVFGL